MNKFILSVLIVIGLFAVSSAETLKLRKLPSQKAVERKIHPTEEFFNKPRKWEPTGRNFNKLLVLLIEFQEDNDPQTTGNGKFVQDPTGYPIDIGRPPHDHAYFTQLLESLRYYYLAVSYGSFEVEYDIFPFSEPGNFFAYVLPQEMRYYNPPGADYNLMISRFEEYFHDVFTTADLDENIDFGQYEHFLIIHAGSDFQHDFAGDTPADIPSFFIQVGTGKEVIVDDGIIISHACNVPETITQDVEIELDGSEYIHYNYGVINSVLVHEFGHSLGFVDLYNTMNNTPQVGYYDIMDSGGNSRIGYPWTTDSIFVLEGVFPALPSPWSRIQAFESDFRARGILKDISQFDLTRPITVLPSSLVFSESLISDSTAYFITFPLNESEYLLIENRQVDPDGDGGAAIIASDDFRVILAPSYLSSSVGVNYEYDFLLPGFMDEDYNSYGGGLLIWHIDESILAENDNYQNNTVNILHERRAVKILEADNIDDIGNPYSMFWQGTAYEPFFRYMPLLDDNGWFTGWDDKYLLNINGELQFIGNYFSHELSSTSKPALFSNSGYPSLFSVFDISSYSLQPDVTRLMSFRFGIRSFDNSQKIVSYQNINSLGRIGNVNGHPTFVISADDQLSFFSLQDNEWIEVQNIPWIEIPINVPVPADLNADGEDEFLLAADNSLFTLDFEQISSEDFPATICDLPLWIEEWATLAVSTEQGLFLKANNSTEILDINQALLGFDGSYLIAASENTISFITESFEIDRSLNLPGYLPDYQPVTFIDELDSKNNSTFVQKHNGDIFKIQNGTSERIFRLEPYSYHSPTQLSLGYFGDSGEIYLVFGADCYAFAITLDGSLASGFPVFLENRTLKSYSYPRLIRFSDQILFFAEEENGGYLAIDPQGQVDLGFSLFWDKSSVSDLFFWDESSLHFIFADQSNNLFTNEIYGIYDDPIIWNGRKNRKYSIFSGTRQINLAVNPHFDAFAYPNPARNGELRFRISQARADISLNIYDIAGNKIRSQKVIWNESDLQDIRLRTDNLSSGVYFATIKSRQNIKKITFAIEN